MYKDIADIKSLILNVDFGDIDGLYDPNLEKYFVDDSYWNKIIEDSIFYVIGRKGTGKSAIYNWIEKQSYKNGSLVSNLSFKAFPFEKFLKLSDDQFSKPNQYQSIWRNIILTEFAALIAKDQTAIANDEFNELKAYVDYIFGEDVIDLHKQITTIADKNSGGITLKSTLLFKSENSQSKVFEDEVENITRINRRLENLIINYFIEYDNNKKFILQFDQLDDNFNQLQKYDEYNQAIISLFKVVYDLNQTFRSKNINFAKAIIYLRSDIFYSLNSFDAESARWDRFKLNLNWSIVNKLDWQNSRLEKVINKRIASSVPEINENEAFNVVFNNNIIKLQDNLRIVNIFKYMIHRTFHRPRDLVQFCIKIQDEVKRSDEFYFRTIRNAEKEYSLWLLSEVENEVAVKIKNINVLYEFLRLMGSKSFTLNDFKSRYKLYENKINIDGEELLKFLYSVAIIHNVDYSNNKFSGHDGFTEYFSIIRNDRSTFNRDLKIQIHPGFWKGLHTSTYSNRKQGRYGQECITNE